MTSRWLLLSLLLYLGAQEATSGVMDNFNDGLKMAGQMFGINTAADVANLVAKAFSGNSPMPVANLMSFLQNGFQPPQAQEEEVDQSEQQSEAENAQEEPPTENSSRRPQSPLGFDSGQILSNMLRMVGFDTRKLGALALNAIIMIAQAIGSTIMQATRGGGASLDAPDALYEPSEHRPRSLSLGSPIDWFLQRPDRHSKRLLKDIMDRDLPEHIVDIIDAKERSKDGLKAGCLKMLMCKSQPIIWGMQDSLKKRLAGEAEEPEESDSYFNKKIFFKYLPKIEDFREHSASCEKKYYDECPKNATSGEYL